MVSSKQSPCLDDAGYCMSCTPFLSGLLVPIPPALLVLHLSALRDLPGHLSLQPFLQLSCLHNSPLTCCYTPSLLALISASNYTCPLQYLDFYFLIYISIVYISIFLVLWSPNYFKVNVTQTKIHFSFHHKFAYK